jgi:type IV secretion system protein VirD4
MLKRFAQASGRWLRLAAVMAGKGLWALLRHRVTRIGAAVVGGLLLLLWLDAWLLGSAAALAMKAANGPPDLAAWKAAWLARPVTTIRAMIQPATAEAASARELWISLQLPLCAGLGWLGWKLYQLRQVRGYESDKKTYGSSHFMTPQEVKRFLKAGLGAGLILGMWDSTWFHYPFEYPPRSRGRKNQFVIIYGGAGKGKSRGYIIPNLLNETVASVIVTDPKGEVFAKTVKAMEAKGYEIWLFNLHDMAVSMRYNPLAYCRDAKGVYRFVDTLINNTSNPEQAKSSDPFWTQAEQAYLEALTLYLLNERPPEERHLPSLLRLATRLPREPGAMDQLFDALPDDHPARGSYDIFRLAEDKTRAGILIGAAVRLRLWTMPNLAAMTAGNDFDLRELGRRKIALYLLIPDDESTYAPVTSLLFAQAIQELYAEAGQQPGQRLQVPVRLRIDEAANVGRIPEFAKKVSTMRGRGISPEIVLQSASQGWDLYGKTWEAIEENCDWQLFLGGNSLGTAKSTSEKLGVQTVRTESSNDKGTTEGTSKRELMTPDEVRRLPDDELLVFPAGALPIRLKKVDYSWRPEWANLAERSYTEFTPPARGPLVITNIEALIPQPEQPKAPAQTETTPAPPPKRDPLAFLDRK